MDVGSRPLDLPAGGIDASPDTQSAWQRRNQVIMPRGDKSSYTQKQKRQAEHIEKGYEKKGVSEGEAERRAWATVNKTTGGGKKSGSGRGKKANAAPSKKGGKATGKKSNS